MLDEHIQKYEDKPGPDVSIVKHNDRHDISRGKERIPISLSGPYTKELIRDFFYINRSVMSNNAQVGTSMARIGEDDRCSNYLGNCLDNPTPCE